MAKAELQPCCPRCGYDQRGVITTWADTCPLDGTCSECGLAFAWADVFVPDRTRVRGFVEHSEGAWRTFFAAWRTLRWSFNPSGFWRRVRLEHACVPRRWMAYILATTGLFLIVRRLLVLVLFILANVSPTPPAQAGGLSLFAPVSMVISEWSNYAVYQQWHRSGRMGWGITLWHLAPPAAFGVGALCVMMPVMLLLLPYTRKRLKIRAPHVIRAGVYGALPLWLVLIVLEGLSIHRAVKLASEGPGRFFGGLRAIDPWADLWRNTLYWCDRHQIQLAMLGFAWVLWWWGSALRTGFRAKGWAPILIAQAVAAVLAGAVIAVLHPDFWRLLTQWV
ncbi:MAG: hypothetical protein ACREJO_13120 [Phycisphaerales bacterium]